MRALHPFAHLSVCQEELTYALDAAGQVYIFGKGPSGQFTGTCRRETFRGWNKVGSGLPLYGCRAAHSLAHMYTPAHARMRFTLVDDVSLAKWHLAYLVAHDTCVREGFR